MGRVMINLDWDGWQREATAAAEQRARDLLKLYGFSLVSVRAFQRKDGISFVLTGADTDVRKAKALFSR